MGALLLKFIAGHWLQFAIVLAIGGAYVGGDIKGRLSQRPAIEKLRAQADAREAAIAQERTDWNHRLAAAEQRAAADATAIAADQTAGLAQANADLARALELERMRRTTPSGAPAQPASAAPVSCREYEAAPGLLPQRDRELLVRLGDAANRVVLERNAAVAQYVAVKRLYVEYDSHREELAEVF